jgi:SOS response associated peptidase (SRAP)
MLREWKKIVVGKQPYKIALADGRLMVLAGLWDTRRSPAGQRVRSFAIITMPQTELCAKLHDWMEVVLGLEVLPERLGRRFPTCKCGFRGSQRARYLNRTPPTGLSRPGSGP